ncbi:MAG TPA: P-loop NTPase [Actinomycetes bacterium]|jgi:pilus assembly protein CpaE|nr:P-loop NTPase [Actinomycetes bacterium]
MAVVVVEPDDGSAAWLAHALSGVADRAVRTTSPDETMAALATEGPEIMVAMLGPGIGDREALELAGRLQQAAPEVSVVLIRERDSGELLRAALRVGVKDVLPASSDAATLRASTARVLEIASELRSRLAGGDAPPPEPARERPGKIITVFSPKGGCGKTFLSTNLAVALVATGAKVVLVDLDLDFGDVAIMLQLFPTRTIQDAARAPELDAVTLKSYLTPHQSGISALVAPTEPTLADTVCASSVATILKLLRTSFGYVVVDTPTVLSDQVLVAFDESDAIAMLATLDVPSIKNLKLTLQAMEQLRYPRSRVRLVVNRADSRVGLRLLDVERLLDRRVDASIPSSRSVPLSVNKGTPIVLEEPRGSVAEAIRRVARQFTPPGPKEPGPPSPHRSLFQRS